MDSSEGLILAKERPHGSEDRRRPLREIIPACRARQLPSGDAEPVDARDAQRADDEPERAGIRADRLGRHRVNVPPASAVLPARRPGRGLGRAGGGGVGGAERSGDADPGPDELEGRAQGDQPSRAGGGDPATPGGPHVDRARPARRQRRARADRADGAPHRALRQGERRAFARGPGVHRDGLVQLADRE